MPMGMDTDTGTDKPRPSGSATWP